MPTLSEGPETPTEWKCESVSDGPTGEVAEMLAHLKM